MKGLGFFLWCHQHGWWSLLTREAKWLLSNCQNVGFIFKQNLYTDLCWVCRMPREDKLTSVCDWANSVFQERWTLHSVASKWPWHGHSIEFNLHRHITLTKVLNHLISLPLNLLNGFNGIVSLLKYVFWKDGTAESPYVKFLWPLVCSISSNKAWTDVLFFVLNENLSPTSSCWW